MTRSSTQTQFLRCAAPRCRGKHLDGSPYCARHQSADSVEESVETGGLGWAWALLPAAGAIWCLYYALALVPLACDQVAFNFSTVVTAPFSCVDGTASASSFAWLSPLSSTFVGSCLIAIGLGLALAAVAFLSPLWRSDQS